MVICHSSPTRLLRQPTALPPRGPGTGRLDTWTLNTLSSALSLLEQAGPALPISHRRAGHCAPHPRPLGWSGHVLWQVWIYGLGLPSCWLQQEVLAWLIHQFTP